MEKRLTWAVALLALLTLSPAALAASSEECDTNDDGVVNYGDISVFFGRFGATLGSPAYLAGLDLNGDQIIDFSDLFIVFGCIGQTADNSFTIVAGRVTDGDGSPLEGVTVQLDAPLGVDGEPTLTTQTNRFGFYAIVGGDLNTPQNHISFIGSTAVNDPSPGGSGVYPTIPHKPIFVNDGTLNIFRPMALPERDYAGALDLNDFGVCGPFLPDQPTICNVNQDMLISNVGTSVLIPQGCEVILPPNEQDTLLSIAQIDPNMLPAPMPLDLSSSLFVTFQPGGTVFECPQPIVTTAQNVDGYPLGVGDLIDGPFLAGVQDGVFAALAPCEVEDTNNNGEGDVDDVMVCEVGSDFEFAWYHWDRRFLTPCPRTTVVGSLNFDDGLMLPIVGGRAFIPGVPAVGSVAPDGSFRIDNVPAGANGPLCFSRPFELRAFATADGPDLGTGPTANNGIMGDNAAENGMSGQTTAVPGGTTDVGMIKLGDPASVSGAVRQLSQISPRVEIPVPGADVELRSFSPDSFFDVDFTAFNGSFGFPSLPPMLNPFLEMSFSGDLPTPDGGTRFKFLSAGANLPDIEAGDTVVRNLLVVGSGGLQFQLVDADGLPLPFEFVELESFEQDLGDGFQSPFCLANTQTDENGFGEFDLDAFCGRFFRGEEGAGGNGNEGIPLGQGVLLVGGRGGDFLTDSRALDAANCSPHCEATEIIGPPVFVEVPFEINSDGEVVDLGVIEVTAPGGEGEIDILETRVTGSLTGPAEIQIDFAGPLGGFFFEGGGDVVIEFDVDGTDSGEFSEVREFYVPGSVSNPDLAPGDPDFRIYCYFEYYGPYCELLVVDGPFFGGLETWMDSGDVDTLHIEVPNGAIGSGPVTFIVGAAYYSEFFEQLDVTPESGAISADLSSPATSSTPDPVGDFHSGFFECEECE